MIYRHTSCDGIILKIAREFKQFDAEMIGDVVEWIGEALEAIGYFGQTVKKEYIPVTIKNYRGQIPCDLIKLNGEPLYNGYPLPYGTGNFKHGSFNKSTTSSQPRTGDFSVNLNLSTQQNVEDIINNLGKSSLSYPSDDCYIIQPGYFKTSFEEGTIYIDYEAFMTDENGYPMIPDVYEFKEACTKYCIMKMLYSGYDHPAVNYQQSKQEWENAGGAARGRADQWDRARANSFINSWVRMIPNINPSDQLYETLKNRENIRR